MRLEEEAQECAAAEELIRLSARRRPQAGEALEAGDLDGDGQGRRRPSKEISPRGARRSGCSG